MCSQLSIHATTSNLDCQHMFSVVCFACFVIPRGPNWAKAQLPRVERNPRHPKPSLLTMHDPSAAPAADHPPPRPAPAELGGPPVCRPPTPDPDNRRPIVGRLAEQRREIQSSPFSTPLRHPHELPPSQQPADAPPRGGCQTLPRFHCRHRSLP
jgi:hypothetical protein